MHKAVIGSVIFLGGVALGTIIGARATKRKYEAAKDEEITQMRNMHIQMLKERSTEEAIVNAYNDLMAEKEAKEKKEKETEKKHEEIIKKEVDKFMNPFGLSSGGLNLSLEEAKKKAKDILKEEGYSSDKDGHPLDEDDEDDEDEESEPILERVSRSAQKSMKESYVISPAEFGEEDYEEIELTYYADDILTDDHGDIIEDPEEIIGPAALSTFGEYEDDAVYVRNDERRCDYAVLKDMRNYSDLPRGRR